MKTEIDELLTDLAEIYIAKVEELNWKGGLYCNELNTILQILLPYKYADKVEQLKKKGEKHDGTD